MESSLLNNDGIELRSMERQKLKIINDSEPIPKDIVDILKEKSSIVGVNDDSEKLKFSKDIRKAYTDIQDAFNGRTKVIMEIVASVPDVKIIYLPNEDNIRKYEEYDEPEFILEGITYAKSETIIIAAKEYEKTECYRRFLGVIIHEFCHFAVHETFGNVFKPYYADDEGAGEKWKKLVKQYKASDLDEFPVIKELFNYEETKWVDELVVRYPQMFVEYHDSEFLYKFESIFIDLHSIYVTTVHKEFESEKDKIASLRSVNKKSLLGDKKSKLYVNSLETEKTMNFDGERLIVKTNHTYLVMKNIFKTFHGNLDFKSKFMFTEIQFLESDENINLIDKAMQCKKQTFLIIDGHDDAYEDSKIQEKLAKLLNSLYVCRLIIILHEIQIFHLNAEVVVEHEPMIFKSSDLTTEFKNSLKVNFQGSELSLDNLIESNLIEKICEDYFKVFFSKLLTKETISVGNQLKVTHDRYLYLEGTYEHENAGSWNRLNLNDDACLVDLFKKNPHIIIKWLPPKIKEKSEALKMCTRLKSIYPDHWIVHIDFSRPDYPLFDLPTNSSEYWKYFLKEFLQLDSIENEILQHFLNKGKVIFIFGGTADKTQHIFNNIRKFLKFLAKLKNMNKICVFTQTDEFQSLKGGSFEEIRLCAFEQFKTSLSEEIRNDDGMLKANAHYFDLSMRAFSRKMFYLANKGLNNDTEGLQDKINFNNQAESYFILKNYVATIEDIKAALKIESNSEFALNQDIRSLKIWENVLFEQKKYSEAMEKSFETFKLASFEKNDREKSYLINKAVCHYICKKYDQSIEFINEALKIASNSTFSQSQNARACYILGFTLQEKKKYEEAIEQFKNAHLNCGNYSIKNQRRFSLMNQANSYFSMKKYDKAIEYIEKSFLIKLDIETDIILDIYATSLWQNALSYLKDNSAALQKLENILIMCTDEMIDESKIHLIDVALCYCKLKKYDKAIEFNKKSIRNSIRQ